MKEENHVVLGSEGFIGKYLVDFLKNQGKNVLEWDIKNDESQDCRIADLHLRKNDILYFFAWEVGGAKYLNRQNTQMEQICNNLDLMKNVFDQLKKSGNPFVFISSQLASGQTTYGTLKRLGEIWTKQLNGCCLRLWNAYGAYEKPSIRSHVISDFIHQALLDGRIITMSSGEEERQFVHVTDICRAIQSVLNIHSNKVHDVTSFEWIKIACVAEIIAGCLDVKVALGKEKGESQPTSMKGKLPGWFPEISFVDGIRETVNLYRNVLRKKN